MDKFSIVRVVKSLLMSNPYEERTLRKVGRWSVEEIDAMFAGTLGMDMVNPAPVQAPKE